MTDKIYFVVELRQEYLQELMDLMNTPKTKDNIHRINRRKAVLKENIAYEALCAYAMEHGPKEELQLELIT